MKRWYPIIVLLVISGTAPGQVATFHSMGADKQDTSAVFSKKLPVFVAKGIKSYGIATKPVPPDFYTHNFGFFCKQELNMHKAGIPVSFRLGNMEYCNMLEQKGH
jgi:hypothetical protein